MCVHVSAASRLAFYSSDPHAKTLSLFRTYIYSQFVTAYYLIKSVMFLSKSMSDRFAYLDFSQEAMSERET